MFVLSRFLDALAFMSVVLSYAPIPNRFQAGTWHNAIVLLEHLVATPMSEEPTDMH